MKIEIDLPTIDSLSNEERYALSHLLGDSLRLTWVADEPPQARIRYLTELKLSISEPETRVVKYNKSDALVNALDRYEFYHGGEISCFRVQINGVDQLVYLPMEFADQASRTLSEFLATGSGEFEKIV